MVEPTLERWQALYRAAGNFSRLAPWEWMANDDLFAVEDPTTREVGYCNVMGAGGDEFGIAVFLGPDGFEGYCKLMLDEVLPDNLEATALLRALVLSFSDREVLDRRDKDVIRQLGLRFRGKNAWPWFRSQRPGYLPWYLERDEAVFLEQILLEALGVAQRVLAGTVRLTPGVDGKPILTRCNRGGAWEDEWRQPPARANKVESPKPVDEIRLRRLRTEKPAGNEAWLLDVFFLPASVGERGERLRHPCAVLAVTEQGFIAGVDVVEPWTSASERQEAVLRLLEKGSTLPPKLLVATEEVRRLLAPIAAGLGISIRKQRLPMLEAVKADFTSHLLRR